MYEVEVSVLARAVRSMPPCTATVPVGRAISCGIYKATMVTALDGYVIEESCTSSATANHSVPLGRNLLEIKYVNASTKNETSSTFHLPVVEVGATSVSEDLEKIHYQVVL